MTPRGFRQSCRNQFRFLIAEHGFTEELLPDYDHKNDYHSRFINDTTRVIIEGVHYGFGIDIAIGPFAPTLDLEQIKNDNDGDPVLTARALAQARENYAPQFYLDDILALRRPDLRLLKARRYNSTERDIQRKQIRQYAAAVRECCGDLLRGDFSTIEHEPTVRRVQHLG